jgi:hypothetical protein
MIDVTSQINSVRRTVGSRVLEAGEARTVTISQVYDTDDEDLWDACTSADRIQRWFLPVTGDLRLGGRFHLEGNADGKGQTSLGWHPQVSSGGAGPLRRLATATMRSTGDASQ